MMHEPDRRRYRLCIWQKSQPHSIRVSRNEEAVHINVVMVPQNVDKLHRHTFVTLRIAPLRALPYDLR